LAIPSNQAAMWWPRRVGRVLQMMLWSFIAEFASLVALGRTARSMQL
jgi:hypothetical protein